MPRPRAKPTRHSLRTNSTRSMNSCDSSAVEDDVGDDHSQHKPRRLRGTATRRWQGRRHQPRGEEGDEEEDEDEEEEDEEEEEDGQQCQPGRPRPARRRAQSSNTGGPLLCHNAFLSFSTCSLTVIIPTSRRPTGCRHPFQWARQALTTGALQLADLRELLVCVRFRYLQPSRHLSGESPGGKCFAVIACVLPLSKALFLQAPIDPRIIPPRALYSSIRRL